MLTIGQRWTAIDGQVWRVAQIYRADGYVLMHRIGWRELQAVSFTELGRHYDPDRGA